MTRRLPIAIWDTENAALYHESSIEIQDAWDAYAQAEADKLEREDATVDRHLGIMHRWTPPLTFQRWKEQYATKPDQQ